MQIRGSGLSEVTLPKEYRSAALGLWEGLSHSFAPFDSNCFEVSLHFAVFDSNIIKVSLRFDAFGSNWFEGCSCKN